MATKIVDEIGYTVGAVNPDVSEWMFDRVTKRCEEDEEENSYSNSSRGKSSSRQTSNRWK